MLGVFRARRCEGYVIASASRPDEAVATLVAEGVPVVLVNRLADVAAPSVTSNDAGVTGLFQRLGDKWSLLTLTLLGGRPHRFTELNRRIEGISQRMLTRL